MQEVGRYSTTDMAVDFLAVKSVREPCSFWCDAVWKLPGGSQYEFDLQRHPRRVYPCPPDYDGSRLHFSRMKRAAASWTLAVTRRRSDVRVDVAAGARQQRRAARPARAAEDCSENFAAPSWGTRSTTSPMKSMPHCGAAVHTVHQILERRCERLGRRRGFTVRPHLLNEILQRRDDVTRAARGQRRPVSEPARANAGTPGALAPAPASLRCGCAALRWGRTWAAAVAPAPVTADVACEPIACSNDCTSPLNSDGGNTDRQLSDAVAVRCSRRRCSRGCSSRVRAPSMAVAMKARAGEQPGDGCR